MTLIGDAVFQDDGQGQELRGDSLKVWLQPDDQAKTGSELQQCLKPHQLEAKGHVTANSPDLHIKEPTEHLVLWFKVVAKPLAGTSSLVEETAKRAAGVSPLILFPTILFP